MMMLTKEIKKRIPKLYANEKKPQKEQVVHVKYFTPWGNWTWYATEFDGEDRFYGYVVGDYPEWGYFSLSELESVKGPFGLKIERDRYFGPIEAGKVSDIHCY